jgi:murein L,D-transpeptidase YcbB/YkuD
MRGLRLDRILSGTAFAFPLAVAFSLTATPAPATPETSSVIEASVPMPEASTIAPPTAADVAPAAQTPPETAPANTTPVETTTAAPVETPPPDPLASLDPADRPIAERIRDILPKSDRVFSNRKERQAVETFYQNRNLAPLWFDKGVQNARAKAAIARINQAAADGLDPKDYKIPEMTGTSAEALADAELKITALVIVFARHLQAGRFPYSRIGGEVMLPQAPPDPAAALTKLADAADAGKALDEFSPPQPAYRALRAKLAELRNASGAEEINFVRIPDGALLKPGMDDARVPLLRKRLKLADADNDRYDDALVQAVKAFQKAAGVNSDGVVGPATLRLLNGAAPPRRADTITTIIANMERWRWIPRDLGNAHVVLNIPNYTLRVMKDGKEVWQTRVVVGKPSTATPMLTETMKFITVNPTWNVPPSIVNNEYLPALAQDPSVMARMGIRVVSNSDGSVHMYQPPGDNNALGRIRFNFPNRFLVYQHDTPDKHLFKHDKRAYSHGCMRVMDPLQYAEVLLSIVRPGEGYTAERLRKMYGPAEVNIQFPTPIPVHITYQTAFVDDAGELQLRPDIYNIDARTTAAIRNDRGVVEPMQERVIASSAVQRAKPKQQQPRTVGFFEALFGTGAAAAPPRPKNKVR